MPNAQDLGGARLGAIVAPAGHGKTELIAELAARGARTLVLTHTNAGVDAIRGRLKRLKVPYAKAVVDTIAGWCGRYAYAFPAIAKPPADPPRDDEWEQFHIGVTAALSVSAVREVVAASYDRILIDEYQDCGEKQHLLAIAMSEIVPTLIFGDPMQGIFEFARPSLSWNTEIHPSFPLLANLTTPYRWNKKNAELGSWIAQTRECLIRGDTIDLRDPRITYRQCDDAFDMSVFFEGHEGKEGSFAAIHCNKQLCYGLASATNGGFQAIEEVAAKTLTQFALEWDHAQDVDDRGQVIRRFFRDCFRKKAEEVGTVDPEAAAIVREMKEAMTCLGVGNGCEAAVRVFALARRNPRWKCFRGQLWRDAERAFADLANMRSATLSEAVSHIRRRASALGRRLPHRTVSTPLLLKGLEFDHVVLPDASSFCQQSKAQAKLFYVAISRASQSLTIAAPEPFLRFSAPRI